MKENAAACKGNIVVVDDIRENVKFFVRILGEEGYRVGRIPIFPVRA